MTTPAFATATIQVNSSTGTPAQVKIVLLPNGAAAVAHAFVDASGNLLDPAQDTTVQAATAAILAASAALAPGS